MLSNCFWRKTDTGPTKSGHPQNRAAIGYIVLNKSLDKAVAEVVEEYNGSGVLLHKTHSGWKEVGGLYHWEE